MVYSIIYSNRKTISISLNKGEISVKAPIGTDEKTIAEIVDKHAAWINKNLEIQHKREHMFSDLTPEDVNNLKKEARVYFKDKTEEFSKIMGLKYGRITITSAQKRFGSCSSQKNISYSYRLMLYPEAAREYVVVHELAHTVEMNHSKRFYEIIECVLPDYKARRRMLKLK